MPGWSGIRKIDDTHMWLEMCMIFWFHKKFEIAAWVAVCSLSFERITEKNEGIQKEVLI